LPLLWRSEEAGYGGWSLVVGAQVTWR